MTGTESARVRAAQSRTRERRSQRMSRLEPLGWATIIVVVASALTSKPTASGHGTGLAVTIALGVYVLSLIAAIYIANSDAAMGWQVAVTVLLGASGIVMAALQPSGASVIGPSVAVWLATIRLRPPVLAWGLAGAITAALAVAEATAVHAIAEAVAASVLLCLVLGMMGHFVRRSHESEERAEILLAQLQDAREAEAEAAVVAERGRIAGELHDVLAHSLSGLAIQIEGARMLAEREQVSPRLRQTIGRSAELVKDGLREAKQAVGALRGEAMPGLDGLPALVDQFGRDANIRVDVVMEGTARTLPREAEVALYRGAQEALTNVARYAPGTTATVQLSYDIDTVRLIIEDTGPAADVERPASLAGAGGGNGLAAMRERVEAVGGSLHAGPVSDGWRVKLEVPA